MTATASKRSADLLAKIKDLYKRSTYSEKQVHRMKIELYQTVYAWAETEMAQRHYDTVASACTSLGKELGIGTGPARSWYRYGKFIRDEGLDPEQLIPSSLASTAKPLSFSRLSAHQQKKVCDLLNSGAGPGRVKKYLRKTGKFYTGEMSTTSMRTWVRRKKKSYKDFHHEMEDLRSRIALLKCADGHDVQLSVFVDGEEVYYV